MVKIDVPEIVPDHAIWAFLTKTRDNFTCQDCGYQGTSNNEVHAHHRSKDPELKLSLSNGATLCYDCHLLRHYSYIPVELAAKRLNIPTSSVIELLEVKIFKGRKNKRTGKWVVLKRQITNTIK